MVFLHGSWTLILSTNSDKLISQITPIPTLASSLSNPDDPLDDELVDWEDNDLQDPFNDNYIDEELDTESDKKLLEALQASLHNKIAEAIFDTFDDAELEALAKENERKLEALLRCFQSQPSTAKPSLEPNNTQIYLNNHPKRPSTLQNKEAGFLLHPSRFAKKKTPENQREGTIPFNPSIICSQSDAKILNYSKACGVNFVGSPNHNLECLEVIHKLETSRASCVELNADTPLRSANQ